MQRNNRLTAGRTLLAAAAALACLASQAATIVVTSRDPAGVGFNDPTPVDPVGGNPGTTLGEQRMNVYKHVAKLWEAALQSDVTITVSAAWEALTCTSTTAVLGSAGAWNIWRDFANSQPGTWYPQALANKLSGVNLTDGIPDDGSGFGNVDIKTQFNINLGNPDCLAGSPFYLGLDGNAGNKVNFMTTLLHELGHGLGFSVLTVQTSTGNRLNANGSAFVATGGLPSVWEQFMLDNTTGKTWLNMTSTERRASAINPQKLAWTGSNAVTGAASTLSSLPSVLISSPVPGGTPKFEFATASFGPPASMPGNLGTVAYPGGSAPTFEACSAFTSAQAAAVAGKVALVDRGTCSFVIKVKNAQDAGAIGVLVANSTTGAFGGMGGTDPSITIPSVMIPNAAGTTLKSLIATAARYGSRSTPGTVRAALGLDPTRRAGADALGRPLLYTPNPLQSGSSVSHWDTSAVPNLLMEPSINSDLTNSLVPPLDLTVPLLKDLGWTTPPAP